MKPIVNPASWQKFFHFLGARVSSGIGQKDEHQSVCSRLKAVVAGIFKGSLVCKTSVLRTFNSCSTTTHHTSLIIHHSSYTTHHTPLIIHHSSYTTHHTPLIIHHSSYTTHHTPLIIHHSSYITHHTPLIIHHSSYTTHHTPLIIHHSSYTIHHSYTSCSRCRFRGRCSTL